MASFIEELRQRRVVRALLAYGAGVAAVLQGTDMVFAALALPDLAYRIIVIAAIAGFPLVATLSWVYDLTAQGLRRTAEISPEEGRAPYRSLGTSSSSAPSRSRPDRPRDRRGGVADLRYPSSDDGRVGLAIFPLRTTGSTGTEWSEGAADLLATALEGTPSLRVVDPWSLWSSLRPEAGAAARVPDPEEAETLAEHVGAQRFLLGSVVPSGDGLEVAFRLYRVGRAEPMEAFTVSVVDDDMAGAVRDAAVRVLTRVWGPLRTRRCARRTRLRRDTVPGGTEGVPRRQGSIPSRHGRLGQHRHRSFPRPGLDVRPGDGRGRRDQVLGPQPARAVLQGLLRAARARRAVRGRAQRAQPPTPRGERAPR